MITRKRLLFLLKEVTREDQPVLGRIDGQHWGCITLWPKHDAVVMGGSIQLSRVNVSLEGGPDRFVAQWVRYNHWLHYWYLGKSLGPIAANVNEHRTQLRAAGYSEEKVEKTIEDLRVDRARYKEYKKGTRFAVPIKLVLTDWLKDGASVYNSSPELSSGVFHCGTTFDGAIVLETADQEDELRQALADGYQPVFVVGRK